MNRYKKLFSDTVILAVGTFGSKLLVFLLMPFYTAWLSTTEYGTAELITGTANLLIPIACVGITNGIFRFAAERDADRAKVFSTSLALLGAGLAVFLLLSPLLNLIGLLTGYVALVVCYVFFADVQALCAQFVRAADHPKLFALQGIFNTLMTIVLNVVFLVGFDLGVTGYVLSVVISNILTTVLLVVSAKLWREFSIRKIDRALAKELLRFSLPMIPTTICWLITDLSDRYMVTYFCGVDVNGVYSAAYKIPTVVTLVSGIFMQAWQFSAVSESADGEECKKFYSEVFSGFISLVMIGSAGLILLSRFLTGLLLNVSYADAWKYMPTLLCASCFEAFVSFLATVYLVRKKTRHSFFTALAGTTLNVILNAVLIPMEGRFGGAVGAAIATFAGYTFVLILRLVDAPRIIPFRLHLPRLTVDAVLLVAAAVVMTLDPPGAILWTLLIFVLITAGNAPAMIRNLFGLAGKRQAETGKDE